MGSIVLRATFSPAAAFCYSCSFRGPPCGSSEAQTFIRQISARVAGRCLQLSIGKCSYVPGTSQLSLYIFNLLHKNQEYGITGRNCYNSWRNSRVAVGCSLGARRPGWKEQPSQHRAVRPLQRLSRDLPRRSPRRAADGRLALSGSCGPAGELAHLVRSHEVSKNEPPAS